LDLLQLALNTPDWYTFIMVARWQPHGDHQLLNHVSYHSITMKKEYRPGYPSKNIWLTPCARCQKFWQNVHTTRKQPTEIRNNVCGKVCNLSSHIKPNITQHSISFLARRLMRNVAVCLRNCELQTLRMNIFMELWEFMWCTQFFYDELKEYNKLLWAHSKVFWCMCVYCWSLKQEAINYEVLSGLICVLNCCYDVTFITAFYYDPITKTLYWRSSHLNLKNNEIE